MKNLFILLLICNTYVIKIIAQDIPHSPTESIDLNPIYKRLESIETQLDQLEREELNQLASRIELEYGLIFGLESSAQNLLEKVHTIQSYSLLAQVNNPSSDILGFCFIDVMVIKLEETLVVPEKEKSRFNNGIQNILTSFKTIGPILSTASPTVSLLSTVVGSISTFSTDRGFKDKKSESSSPLFDRNQIERFSLEMKPYIMFYEELNRTNLSLQQELEEQAKRIMSLQNKIQKSKYKAEIEFGIKITPYYQNRLRVYIQNKIVSTPSSNSRLDNVAPEIITASEELKSLVPLAYQLAEASQDLDRILADNLQENLEMVKAAKNLPVFSSGKGDKQKLFSIEQKLAGSQSLFKNSQNDFLSQLEVFAARLQEL